MGETRLQHMAVNSLDTHHLLRLVMGCHHQEDQDMGRDHHVLVHRG